MKTPDAADLLIALGHESRLGIFRLLVEAGSEGLSAGAISERLNLGPSNLSFHLAHLRRAGLIKGRHSQRFIYYSANYPLVDELLSFLTINCCQGEPCLPKTTGSGAKAVISMNAIGGRKGKRL